MKASKNGKNHFLVGQEMNGSTVVSCVETKSPSGNRWFKIHREFILKNGSKFWLDKLISREKGEETLADWLKEQAELKARQEGAKAREMTRPKIQNRNGASTSSDSTLTTSEKMTKTKLALPPKKHKPISSHKSTQVSKSRMTVAKKPLLDGNSSQKLDLPPLPRSPEKKQNPSSLRTGLGQDSSIDVQKTPKKPTSLRNTTTEKVEDAEGEMQPEKPSSLSRLQERPESRTKAKARPPLSRSSKLKTPDKIKFVKDTTDAEESKTVQLEKKNHTEMGEKLDDSVDDKAVEAERGAEVFDIRDEDDRNQEQAQHKPKESLQQKEKKTQQGQAENFGIIATEAFEEDGLHVNTKNENMNDCEEGRDIVKESWIGLEEEEAVLRKGSVKIKERRQAEELAHSEDEFGTAVTSAVKPFGIDKQTASGGEPTKETHAKSTSDENLVLSKNGLVGEVNEEMSSSFPSGTLHEAVDSSQRGQPVKKGTENLLARLPKDSAGHDGIAQVPYDEGLAGSSDHLGYNESDGEKKKRRKKKRGSEVPKPDDAARRKSRGKRKEGMGSISRDSDPEGTSKYQKKKTKKKKESRRNKTGESDHDISQSSLNEPNIKDAKRKVKKKKGKDKGEDSKSRKKEKNVVVPDIHSQLAAMVERPRRAQGVSLEQDLNGSQTLMEAAPSQDDASESGSAEFQVDPALLDHPLEHYTSDEPPSDSDDDFEYTRVRGEDDFHDCGVSTSQRPSMTRLSNSAAETSGATDRAENTDLGEVVDDGKVSKGDVTINDEDFESLEAVKDRYPTFAKIMGVWVERERKLLYKTPLETVAKKSETKKEVPVPTSPEAPSLGSMVRKWEAKLVRDEPERNEVPPKKLKNVWAEKLEFTKPFTKPSHQKSADEIKLIEDTVEKNFAFKDLTPDEMAPIVDAFERVEYAMGATIGEQGEPENFYSIVQSGEVDFHSDGSKVGTAFPGDAFGELALLYKAPRPAEAKAAGNETVLFQIDQTDFRHIMREQMIRSEEEKLKLLQSVEVFRKLDETDLRQLGTAMVPHKFLKGDNLSATFSEAPFCLVQQGSVTATNADIGPGQSFGEESIFSRDAQKLRVTAMSDGLAFTIDREGFEKVFGDFDRVSKKYQDKQTLVSVRAIRAAKLGESQLDTLVRQITEVEFRAGTRIFDLNARMPPALYLVRSGQVNVVKKNGEERIVSGGGYFGEEYMFFISKQSKDIVPDTVVVKYSAVATETTICGVLPLREIGIISGRIQAIQDIESTQNIALEDLDRHRILGEGQFGVVWLVTVKNIEVDPYALKIQYIDDPCRDDAAECIREEIKMMRSIQHPFIIQVINTYEDKETIAMLLSLAPGGELFDILHRQDVNGWWVSGLAEPIAKFYAMVVADTLAFMHRQKFVFRDLKPENILIDKDGYPVLTDFGFVKKLDGGKTYTFCGTPNYVAPEVVLNVGHDTSADNWSLGVLIYELIDGANPFWEDGMDQQTLYELIAYGLYPPLSRKKCSKAGRDLIGRLLEKDPSRRTGTFREKDILEHKWFNDFDIKELRDKTIKAPWIPDKIRLEDDSH